MSDGYITARPFIRIATKGRHKILTEKEISKAPALGAFYLPSLNLSAACPTPRIPWETTGMGRGMGRGKGKPAAMPYGGSNSRGKGRGGERESCGPVPGD